MIGVVILKKQFPIEINGKTSKLFEGTLSKTCFAGEKYLRSSKFVADRNIFKIPGDYLT